MKSKRTISIVSTFLAIIIMATLVGLGYAKLKSEKPKSGSYSEELPTGVEDPYGEKQVLIDLLNYPVRGDILGAEIGLTKTQSEEMVKIAHEEEDQMRTLRWAKGISVEEYNKQYYAILKASDDRIKHLLNAFQYAKFRDWVVEEWTLERNLSRKIHNYPLLEVLPITFYSIGFLQDQLNLSNKDARAMNKLIHQTKQQILPLREGFVAVAGNPRAGREEKEKIASQIIQQIKPQAQKLEADILKILPASKRKLYESLKVIPNTKQKE